MQGMIEVNDPDDDVEMSYAIERVITVARENGMDDDEIKAVLQRHINDIERGE